MPLTTSPGTTRISNIPMPKKYSSKVKVAVEPDDVFAKLKKDLSRYTKSEDKIQVVRVLSKCTKLRNIPLDSVSVSPSSPDQWEMLQSQVDRTPTRINGYLFQPTPSQSVSDVLTELCHQLCPKTTMDPKTVFQTLLIRLAKSTSAADTYFQLTTLVGTADLILQQTPKAPAPPTELDLYQADGHLHATLTTHHALGLFRKRDVNTGTPWVQLVAAARERVNLTTGSHARQVTLKVVVDKM